jgi:hypothetical protein
VNGNSSSNVDEEKSERVNDKKGSTSTHSFLIYSLNETKIDLTHGQTHLVFRGRLTKCTRVHIYTKKKRRITTTDDRRYNSLLSFSLLTEYIYMI